MSSAAVGAESGLRAIPTISGWPAIKAYLRFRNDPLGVFVDASRALGEAFAFDFRVRKFFVLTAPEMIERVLVKNWRNYTKDTYGYDQLRLILGNGLVTSQGDFWMRQRRIAQPAFHRRRIAGFVETMGQAAEGLADRWAATAAAGERVDVSAEMMAVTLEIVGWTLLNVDVTREASKVGQAVGQGLDYLAYRMRSRSPIPPTWPTRRNRRFHKAMAGLDEVVLGIIQRRRDTGEDAGDLLSMFMLTTDEETGERMNDAQLRDEVMTMFIAGHETTASNLTWTLYLLAQHPDVEEAVRAELDEVLGGRTPSLEDLAQLPLLMRVLKESLRLYPPAPIIARMGLEADAVGGFELPPKAYTLLSPFVTHRLPRLWPEPLRFDPDRFLPEREKARPKFAFFPFSGGRRKCIGDQFALVEAQVVLATLLQRYRLSLAPDQTAEVKPAITIRPKGGLPMTVTAV